MVNLEELVATSLILHGPKETYHIFSRLFDTEAVLGSLFGAAELAERRTLLVDKLLCHWISDLAIKINYQQPFALIARGGHGRHELLPLSDMDIVLIAKGIELEKNPLVQTYDDAVAHTFEQKFGFSLKRQIHSTEELESKELERRDWNAYMDGRVILEKEQCGIDFFSFLKRRVDRCQLYRHNLSLWREIHEKWPQQPDDLSLFNVKEGIGGIRHFHAGVRMQGLLDFKSCREIYKVIENKAPHVLKAFYFLLGVRGWLHVRKEHRRKEIVEEEKKEFFPPKDAHLAEAELLRYSDFVALGKNFGTEAQERLLHARRTINNFSEGIIYRRQEEGFNFGKFLLTAHGLSLAQLPSSKSALEMHASEMQENASSLFMLLREAQQQGIPVSPAIHTSAFADVSHWLTAPHPGFAELYYVSGSLATSLEVLASIGGMDSQLPGFSKLATSIPAQGHHGLYLTRTGFSAEKKKVAQRLIEEEQIDIEQRAGIYLAFDLKHIAEVTPDGSTAAYISRLKNIHPGFSPNSLRLAQFLIEKASLLAKQTERVNSDDSVRKIAEQCGSADNLTLLYLFTRADQHLKHNPGKEPEFWLDMRELYKKAMDFFKTSRQESARINMLENAALLEEQGLDSTAAKIIASFGNELKTGRYTSQIERFAEPLRTALEQQRPTVIMSRISAPSSEELRPHYQIGIAAPNSVGLVALIAGTCLDKNLDVHRAYAYTNPSFPVVLDFFEVASPTVILEPRKAAEQMQSALTERIFSRTDPAAILNALERHIFFEYEESSGLFHLSIETPCAKQGIFYSIAKLLYEPIGADIYAAKLFPEGEGARHSFFFKTPSMDFRETEELVQRHFGYQS